MFSDINDVVIPLTRERLLAHLATSTGRRAQVLQSALEAGEGSEAWTDAALELGVEP